MNNIIDEEPRNLITFCISDLELSTDERAKMSVILSNNKCRHTSATKRTTTATGRVRIASVNIYNLKEVLDIITIGSEVGWGKGKKRQNLELYKKIEKALLNYENKYLKSA